jgi:hypothetical protein
VLDRIEQGFDASDPGRLTAEQGQAIAIGRLQLAIARQLLAEAAGAPVEAVAEAIYRAAWATELMFTPWNLTRHKWLQDGPRKGGLSPKPGIRKRQAQRRARVLAIAAERPHRTAEQVRQHYAERYGVRNTPSKRTIQVILSRK